MKCNIILLNIAIELFRPEFLLQMVLAGNKMAHDVRKICVPNRIKTDAKIYCLK